MNDTRILTAAESTAAYYQAKQEADPSWRPYCPTKKCHIRGERMIKTSFGFECMKCGSKLTKGMNKYRGSL